MSFIIEKNIPIPVKYSRQIEYPFKEMEIGDSFFVKCESKEDATKRKARLFAALKYFKDTTGTQIKITSKYCEIGNETGFRVWRIK